MGRIRKGSVQDLYCRRRGRERCNGACTCWAPIGLVFRSSIDGYFQETGFCKVGRGFYLRSPIIISDFLSASKFLSQSLSAFVCSFSFDNFTLPHYMSINVNKYTDIV